VKPVNNGTGWLTVKRKQFEYLEPAQQRRPFIRFFACGEDLSLEPPTDMLPEQVASGEEPLRVVGAMAGG
jgi:hypothetical protein